MLYSATFAENKVQGLALTKFLATAGFRIPWAWFTSEPFQFVFGLFPPYWISKAYWLALDGNALWPAALILGVVLQVVLVGFLTRRFHRVAFR